MVPVDLAGIEVAFQRASSPLGKSERINKGGIRWGNRRSTNRTPGHRQKLCVIGQTICAAASREIGWGGISAVSQATGMSRTTITAGLRELALSEKRVIEANRIRRPSGGRKSLRQTDPGLVAVLESLIEPATRGDSFRSRLAVRGLNNYCPFSSATGTK